MRSATTSDERRQAEPRPAEDERGTSTLGHDTPEPPGTIDATSLPIAHSLAGDPEKSNLLLIHACSCDEVQCTHPTYHVLCAHMKRFLRSFCWASHSEKWRSYRLAWITAELFAYHALHCTQGHCNVPLCERIREEEIV
ncbi:hypothetical protein PsorP6_000480 [Peronosclerospora sorghi]|uniref:Uncharacterized protein n=1 Tax=Peronosclerospora sorghi TaxID=230839 RepID=A0ACC0WTZ3_9STRA|nr:hypothetical protein PsorP6_000480 [Peronosclerospora sorghi]